uniref:Uncharacterized protein n=1 Tax=Rhizophora mucronata TaxID=61149 RepID=A0A2P2NHH4_RHIMU
MHLINNGTILYLLEKMRGFAFDVALISLISVFFFFTLKLLCLILMLNVY